MPGHWQQVNEGALREAKIRERETKQPPAAMINAEQQATSDLTEISGINEQLLAQDVSNSASGRAIELRTKQAVTNLALIFDSLRRAKKKLAYQLWGKRGHAGLIPQYYTAEKTMRIEGENGQEWIKINEQVIEQDPIAGTIYKTLNDLSQGEFDVVVSDVEASATQREWSANLVFLAIWSLIQWSSVLTCRIRTRLLRSGSKDSNNNRFNNSKPRKLKLGLKKSRIETLGRQLPLKTRLCLFSLQCALKLVILMSILRISSCKRG